MVDESQPDYTSLTVQLLSAYVANNNVDSGDLAGLIQSTRAALIGEIVTAEPETPSPAPVPAVSIRKSLASSEHILSLIDGRPYKTLKRHLAAHGLTPDDYRARYDLPKTYPMVAPAYAEMRRAVAQRTGLGQRSASLSPVAEPEAPEMAMPEPAAPKAKPGRKPRAVSAADVPPATEKTEPKPAVATNSEQPDTVAKSSPKKVTRTAKSPTSDASAPKRGRRKLGIKTT